MTRERNRGRHEERRLRGTTELNTYLVVWSAVAQAMELERTVIENGEVTRERSSVVCSRTPEAASPQQLLALIRGHWRIETRHFVRDVTFGEDTGRMRTGAPPQILAAFRNGLITLLRRAGQTAFALLRRRFPLHNVPA